MASALISRRIIGALVLFTALSSSCSTRRFDSRTLAAADEVTPQGSVNCALDSEGRATATSQDGVAELRLTAYGSSGVRLQFRRLNTNPPEQHFPDEHYEMVAPSGWQLRSQLTQTGPCSFATGDGSVVAVSANMKITLSSNDGTLLWQTRDEDGVIWKAGNQIRLHFNSPAPEKFSGLGHKYDVGAAEGDIQNRSVDLSRIVRNADDQNHQRNYGTIERHQSPLIVPFFVSSRGYGAFLNSSYNNFFNFDGSNVLGIEDFAGAQARMDLFLFNGKTQTALPQRSIRNGPTSTIARVLDQYTALTGRPRMPPIQAFGLSLSDKAHARIGDADFTSTSEAERRLKARLYRCPDGTNYGDRGCPAVTTAEFFRSRTVEHRAKGYGIDHLVNDNRWRSQDTPRSNDLRTGGFRDGPRTIQADGGRCSTKFLWNRFNFPDLAAWSKFLTDNSLMMTLDFNRCTANQHPNWRETEFAIGLDGQLQGQALTQFEAEVEFARSAPDFSIDAVRSWLWKTIYCGGLQPIGVVGRAGVSSGFCDGFESPPENQNPLNSGSSAAQSPAIALWIDEVDQLGHIKGDLRLRKLTSAPGLFAVDGSDGRAVNWAEARNQYFLLIGKALVEEGWDRNQLPVRPYVWMRGMTAGGQRYGSMWSGDIGDQEQNDREQMTRDTYRAMEEQIRKLQLAGLSGFPFWSHDCGSFRFLDNAAENIGDGLPLWRVAAYVKWAIGFCFFSPIWRPHGESVAFRGSPHNQLPADRFPRRETDPSLGQNSVYEDGRSSRWPVDWPYRNPPKPDAASARDRGDNIFTAGFSNAENLPDGRSGEAADLHRVLRGVMGNRYALTPYVYSIAHEAAETGVPMARPMLLDFPEDFENAWERDLQYMWGPSILVRPNVFHPSGNMRLEYTWADLLVAEQSHEIWFPPGDWHSVWSGNIVQAPQGRRFRVKARAWETPAFVRSGSIIPMVEPSRGMQKAMAGDLEVHVYLATDGQSNQTFHLVEDDGVSQAYRAGQPVLTNRRITALQFAQNGDTFTISATPRVEGQAPDNRTTRIIALVVHGPQDIVARISCGQAPSSDRPPLFPDEARNQELAAMARSFALGSQPVASQWSVSCAAGG